MTTALQLINGSTALTPLQEAILAEQADETTAFDYIPTRIKFPSGGMAAFSTNDGDVLKPPINAIVAVSQKARAWWPGKDTQGAPPLCTSPDGLTGYFNIADPEQAKVAAALPIRHPGLSMMSGAEGPHSCPACPLAQWGSGDGRGMACKSLIRLILLVEGWSMPAIMTIPPTSVKLWNAYASARARVQSQAYFTTWTRFELENATNTAGIKYAVVKLSAVKPLTEAETMAVIDVRRQYAQLVRSMGISSEDYDTGGNGRVVDPTTGEIIEGSAEELPPF